jgi:capsular polysaccharide biosynthesis protein
VEIVTILRTLWHRRVLVCLVALVAIVIGWMLAFTASFPPKSRSYTVGMATTRILVDTPRSQVVAVNPRGSETLGARASVLANLMVEGEVKAAIARRAGLRPSRLRAATGSGGGEPDKGAEEESTTEAPLGPKSYALKTNVVTSSDLVDLPIIQVQTQAPDAKRAMELANAAVAGLSDHLDSKAADEQVDDRRRLRVRGFGGGQASEVKRGPGGMVAVGAGIFVFLMGCAAILIVSALTRGWRVAAASEQANFHELSPESPTLADVFEDESLEPHMSNGSSGTGYEPTLRLADLPDEWFSDPRSAPEHDPSVDPKTRAESA